jgi:hypothetical protein
VKRFQSKKMLSMVSVLGVLGFFTLVGLAQTGATPTDATQDATIKTAGPMSRVMQQITGFTPISGWVANRILRREISRYVQGPLHSRLTLFSGTDLLAGRARGLTISGQRLLLDGYIPLSEFSFSSQPDMPIFASTGKRPILLRPVTFGLSLALSEQDVNRMLDSAKGRQLLSDMNVKLPPFGRQSFDALNTAVHFDGERVNISTLMNLRGASQENALPMTISGKILPEKSSLTLSDLKLQIDGVQDTRDMAQVIEHYFNELVDLNHIKVQRHKIKVQIEESRVSQGMLRLRAKLTVAPEPKALKAALAQRSS